MRSDSDHRSQRIVTSVIRAFGKQLNNLFTQIQQDFLFTIGKLSQIRMISVALKTLG
jgi:hypothetical protein